MEDDPFPNRPGFLGMNTGRSRDTRKPRSAFHHNQQQPRASHSNTSNGHRGRGRGSKAKYQGRSASESYTEGLRNASNLKKQYDKSKESQKKMGFKMLEELAHSDHNEILLNISQKRDAFMDFFKSPVLRPDVYSLIVEIIAKICRSSYDSLKIKILIEVCNSQFLIYLQNYLINLPLERNKASNKLYWDNQNVFWEHLIQFCECITIISPSTSFRTCRSLILSATKVCLQGLSERGEFTLTDEYQSKLDGLQSILTNYEKEQEKKEALGQGRNRGVAFDTADSEPPQNFRDLSVIPTSQDLLERHPFVRPNIIDGSYHSLEHYLDVQFRLLREDCYGPLREGIHQFIVEPSRQKFDSVRIFHNVTFVEPYVSDLNFGYLVEFNEKVKNKFKKINWAHSKRFIYGSLLLFTKDNCKSFIMATVLDHEPKYLVQGKIPVTLVDKSIGMDICIIQEKYTMIESEVYFEPYFHVLNALKDPSFPLDLTMSKYIINVDPEPKLPNYIMPGQKYKIECVEPDNDVTFTVADTQTWPSHEQLGLNESQYEAFKLCLTHEFAVVQGPPGTGKTYLGVKVATTLLNNVQRQNGRCCLLVICYTNHALDQFLEAILPITKSLARIGSQSRNKALEEYNINNLRKNLRGTGLYNDERRELMRIHNFLKSYQECLFTLNNRVLSYGSLSTYVEEIKVLPNFYGGNKEDPLRQWLFSNIDLNVAQCFFNDFENEENFETDFKQKSDEMLLDLEIDPEKLIVHSVEQLETTFSLMDAIKKMKRLQNDYDNTHNNNELEQIDLRIKILNAEIQIFMEMSSKRRRDHNVVFNFRDPRKMKTLDRWLVYFTWVDNIIDVFKEKMVALQNAFEKAAENYKESRMVIDQQVLRTVKVIGITTSAAARQRKLLISLAPPIVIVEEAAEVLEQHIVTSLTRETRHLILIGDHQQLRPSAAHAKLARHYNIEVSLFERMIMNNIHSRQLSVQHRMRPEIAALISPHIYANLSNHPSVKEFPDVRGMASNLLFLSHNYKEETVSESFSKSNEKEADMVLGLANYLVQQDYAPNDVTIISAYAAQMFYMRQKRSSYAHLQGVKITVVDNYQGEESKIILLSLVRNNDEGKIGFLGTENRVCVALSRAREGFYMFGNIDILRKKSNLWDKVAGTLEENGSVVTSLQLRCDRHQEITTVANAAEFAKSPEGGCLIKCNSNLPCGHQCSLICHGYDSGHLKIKCIEKCERILCESGHVCPLMCAVNCEPCKRPVDKVLSCGHVMPVPCSVNITDKSVICDTKITIILPHCGHEVVKMCGLNMKYVVCPHPCIFRIESCGHMCVRSCHVTNDPKHEKYLCQKPCARAKAGCSAGLLGDREDHQCTKKCHETCDPCVVEVVKKRSGCKHSERVPCNVDVDATLCKKQCSRSLPCNHFCKKKCNEPCGGCTQMVTKVIPECGHSIKVKCGKAATPQLCNDRCKRNLLCGHPCTGICKDPCDETKCTVMTNQYFDSPCGHRVQLPCKVYRNLELPPKPSTAEIKAICLKYCKQPCSVTLMCGHVCQNTCSNCLQGRLHGPCKQICHQTNICGHQCQEPCNQVCPPCKLKCEVRCAHSRCNKLCGDICSPCQVEFASIFDEIIDDYVTTEHIPGVTKMFDID